MKKAEEVKRKEQLEDELLKVRSEIQWREREREELIKENPLPYSIVFIPALFFIPLCVWFGKVIGSIISAIASIFLIVIIQKSFWKSKEYKKLQKATNELKWLRKRKIELERKLDNLEFLEKSKKKKG